MKNLFKKILGHRPGRRILFAFLWLITLFALFHAVENWRGAKAWAAWEQKLAARGESPRFEDHIPKEIPDDQNFAANPVVTKWFDRTNPFQWEDAYHTAKFPSGEDRPSKPSESRPASIDLMEWAIAFRAGQGKETNNASLTTEQAAREILEGLKPSEDELEILAQSSKRPLSRFPVNYNSEDPFSILLPHLAHLKSAVKRLQVRATAYIALKESDKAFADLMLMQRFAESFSSEPFLISALVHVSINSMITDVAWQGRDLWSETQVKDIQSRLLGQNFASAALQGFVIERSAGAKTITFIRGEGLQYFHALGGATGPASQKTAFNTLFTRIMIPRGWFDMEKANVYKMYDEVLSPAFNGSNATFHPTIATENERSLKKEKPNNLSAFFGHRLFAHLLTPALVKTAQKMARAQAETHLCATALALELYKRQNNTYPDTLASLPPKYISKLPHDPIGGSELKYRKTEDSYLLYSIAWNNKDDGGQRGKTFEDLDFVW